MYTIQVQNVGDYQFETHFLKGKNLLQTLYCEFIADEQEDDIMSRTGNTSSDASDEEHSMPMQSVTGNFLFIFDNAEHYTNFTTCIKSLYAPNVTPIVDPIPEPISRLIALEKYPNDTRMFIAIKGTQVEIELLIRTYCKCVFENLNATKDMRFQNSAFIESLVAEIKRIIPEGYTSHFFMASSELVRATQTELFRWTRMFSELHISNAAGPSRKKSNKATPSSSAEPPTDKRENESLAAYWKRKYEENESKATTSSSSVPITP